MLRLEFLFLRHTKLQDRSAFLSWSTADNRTSLGNKRSSTRPIFEFVPTSFIHSFIHLIVNLLIHLIIVNSLILLIANSFIHLLVNFHSCSESISYEIFADSRIQFLRSRRLSNQTTIHHKGIAAILISLHYAPLNGNKLAFTRPKYSNKKILGIYIHEALYSRIRGLAQTDRQTDRLADRLADRQALASRRLSFLLPPLSVAARKPAFGLLKAAADRPGWTPSRVQSGDVVAARCFGTRPSAANWNAPPSSQRSRKNRTERNRTRRNRTGLEGGTASHPSSFSYGRAERTRKERMASQRIGYQNERRP